MDGKKRNRLVGDRQLNLALAMEAGKAPNEKEHAEIARALAVLLLEAAGMDAPGIDAKEAGDDAR